MEGPDRRPLHVIAEPQYYVTATERSVTFTRVLDQLMLQAWSRGINR